MIAARADTLHPYRRSNHRSRRLLAISTLALFGLGQSSLGSHLGACIRHLRLSLYSLLVTNRKTGAVISAQCVVAMT